MNKKIKILAPIILIIAIIIAFILVNNKSNSTILKEDEVSITLDSEFKYQKYLKDDNDINTSKVTFNKKKLNTHKVGNYKVTYTYKDETYDLTVKVKDVNKPTFDIHNIEVDLNNKVKANMLVSNIKDQSKTKVTFAKKYTFDKVKTYNVKVTVSDESNNKTTKKAKVKVLTADKVKPTINTSNAIKEIALDSKIDLKQGIEYKDNRDPNPTLKVDESKLKRNKLGSYKVVFTCTDRSGNKTSVTQTIKVVKKLKTIGSSTQSNEKVVYLTFDDGPSTNTAEILKILAKYHAKATFFVTGTNQKYNYLIKQADKEGHTIGLHTYTHDYGKLYASTDAYFNDLKQVSDMVKSLIGKESKFIRFPGGASNTVSRKYSPGIMTKLSKMVIERGYQYYDWNAGTDDAMGNRVPLSRILSVSTSYSSNNIIMLAHDSAPKTTTVQALPQIIEHYQALGYKFKGIDEKTFAPHQHINN